MSPSHSQIQPKRVLAVFGKRANPLFTVESGREPDIESSDPTLPFVFRDADEGLPERVIAAGELTDIDPETGHATLNFEVNDSAAESTYRLQPGDIRGGLKILMDKSGVETATINSNLSPSELLHVGCHATAGAVEFSLPVAA